MAPTEYGQPSVRSEFALVAIGGDGRPCSATYNAVKHRRCMTVVSHPFGRRGSLRLSDRMILLSDATGASKTVDPQLYREVVGPFLASQHLRGASAAGFSALAHRTSA